MIVFACIYLFQMVLLLITWLVKIFGCSNFKCRLFFKRLLRMPLSSSPEKPIFEVALKGCYSVEIKMKLYYLFVSDYWVINSSQVSGRNDAHLFSQVRDLLKFHLSM